MSKDEHAQRIIGGMGLDLAEALAIVDEKQAEIGRLNEEVKRMAQIIAGTGKQIGNGND